MIESLELFILSGNDRVTARKTGVGMIQVTAAFSLFTRR